MARAHSKKLIEHIGAAIDAAGGWISFADYMREVLYAPGLGYYSAGAAKFGAAGDFVTAPEISPLFGLCLASQCQDIFQQVDGNTIVEAGGGSGRLAATILGELPQVDYVMADVSAELRQRQAETISGQGVRQSNVRWVDGPDDLESFSGVLLANEVIDALPVELFVISDGVVLAKGVRMRDGRFVAATREAGAGLTAAVRRVEEVIGRALPDGYTAEIRPQLAHFISAWAQKLQSGAMIFIDYGCSRAELYAPERHMGTLLCHYRHRAHSDPFVYPGLQDITAWVDFTAVAEAGVAAGLAVGGYATQAHFLMASGIEQRYDELRRSGTDEQHLATLNGQLRRLMMPGEMGERFRVMALTRGMDRKPAGFSFRDLSASL
ncbi:MAG: SAM-dependent methyltransferase [Gammaproteobacteria bacterium]|nr:SAM-dependent methyltransferase [Gammaproteobacteria bacterium]